VLIARLLGAALAGWAIKEPPVVMTTKLSKLQRRIVRLLGMRMAYDS
jgi:hypothetical protein